MSGPKVETADGRQVERHPERDEALDMLRDVDRFGESLVFDEQGNLVSGTPSAPEPALE